MKLDKLWDFFFNAYEILWFEKHVFIVVLVIDLDPLKLKCKLLKCEALWQNQIVLESLIWHKIQVRCIYGLSARNKSTYEVNERAKCKKWWCIFIYLCILAPYFHFFRLYHCTRLIKIWYALKYLPSYSIVYPVYFLLGHCILKKYLIMTVKVVFYLNYRIFKV